MKILIVEDDKNISRLIKDILELAKYETECVFDGMLALEKMRTSSYDLIILDIMLPGLDGLEILENTPNISVPVIYLSSKNDVNTVVKGLKLGAADYMTKPFEPLELLARVELRIGKKEQELYNYKDIKVNISERKVYKEDSKIDLSPKEFDLLVLFMKNIRNSVGQR